MRDGAATYAALARRYGINEETMRKRRKRLGLPPRNAAQGRAIGRAGQAEGVRELREARRKVSEAFAEYRRLIGELRR